MCLFLYTPSVANQLKENGLTFFMNYYQQLHDEMARRPCHPHGTPLTRWHSLACGPKASLVVHC
jgi:hypothetical protein